MPLTAKNIFLDRHRPLFLCEKLLAEKEGIEPEKLAMSSGALLGAYSNLRAESEGEGEGGPGSRGASVDLARSSAASVGSIMSGSYDPAGVPSAGGVVALLQRFGLYRGTDESQMAQLRSTFDAIDTDGGGSLDVDEFVNAFQRVNPALTEAQCRKIFDEADLDGSGDVDFEEFVEICTLGAGDMLKMLGATNRDASGVLKVNPSDEKYFGEKLRIEAPKSVRSSTHSLTVSLTHSEAVFTLVLYFHFIISHDQPMSV